MNPFSPMCMAMMSIIATESKLEHGAKTDFISTLYIYVFQSLLNGLMCSKPEDPIEYLESCLQKVKELGGCEKVKWDTFVSQEKKTLPPLNGGQSRRSFLRNGNACTEWWTSHGRADLLKAHHAFH